MNMELKGKKIDNIVKPEADGDAVIDAKHNDGYPDG
jgi:hypothetical protein